MQHTPRKHSWRNARAASTLDPEIDRGVARTCPELNVNEGITRVNCTPARACVIPDQANQAHAHNSAHRHPLTNQRANPPKGDSVFNTETIHGVWRHAMCKHFDGKEVRKPIRMRESQKKVLCFHKLFWGRCELCACLEIRAHILRNRTVVRET